jgi:hypothetical protein
LNSAVNPQGGEPIFNLENEKLGDKQCHFVGDCCGEVDIVFGLGQLVWGKPKPDNYNADIVVPVKLAK